MTLVASGLSNIVISDKDRTFIRLLIVKEDGVTSDTMTGWMNARIGELVIKRPVIKETKNIKLRDLVMSNLIDFGILAYERTGHPQLK
jgi:hypothetical protein